MEGAWQLQGFPRQLLPPSTLSAGDLRPDAAMTLGLGIRIIKFTSLLLSKKCGAGFWEATGLPTPLSSAQLLTLGKSKKIAWGSALHVSSRRASSPACERNQLFLQDLSGRPCPQVKHGVSMLW